MSAEQSQKRYSNEDDCDGSGDGGEETVKKSKKKSNEIIENAPSNENISNDETGPLLLTPQSMLSRNQQIPTIVLHEEDDCKDECNNSFATSHSFSVPTVPNLRPVPKTVSGSASNCINPAMLSSTASSINSSYQRPKNNRRIVINVGGIRYETYRTTLKLISESRLANISPTNSDYDPIKDEYFFDRDPNSFLAILNFYRTGRLHAPSSVCGNLFYEELTFWGISEHSIQPCCWTGYNTNRECDEILKKVLGEFEGDGKKDVQAIYVMHITR